MIDDTLMQNVTGRVRDVAQGGTRGYLRCLPDVLTRHDSQGQTRQNKTRHEM